MAVYESLKFETLASKKNPKVHILITKKGFLMMSNKYLIKKKTKRLKIN